MEMDILSSLCKIEEDFVIFPEAEYFPESREKCNNVGYEVSQDLLLEL